MKSRTFRSLSVLVLAGSLGGVALNPASAATLPGNGVSEELTVVGSDTTQEVMGAIASLYNVDTTGAMPANPDPDNVHNVKAFGGGTRVVPESTDTNDSANGGCATNLTWYVLPTPVTGTAPCDRQAPNGSSAGRAALAASAAAGNNDVDVARSSSARSSSDPVSLEYYAFARDAVSWNHIQVTAGKLKPTKLTLAQLRSIYDCTFTNWNQVGGPNLGIERYIPQAGSGTRSFFLSNVLGFDPTTFSSASCPAVNQTLPENDSTLPGVAAADRPKAILAWSASQWIAQANNAINPDLRAGSTMGAIGTVNPVKPPTATVPDFTANTAAYGETSTFPGARYVYNVIDTRSEQYQAARQFVGFIGAGTTASTRSKLCDGGYAAQIKKFGFLALPKISGLACRKS